MSTVDRHRWRSSRRDSELLTKVKYHLSDLAALLEEVEAHGVGEDLVYRFWHQSFKVYFLQDITERIVDALDGVRPEGVALNPWFTEIVAAGTGRQFKLDHNDNWLENAKPIVDAFFHARFMLEMVVRYGGELEEAPDLLPSGWAAVLELYQIR
jgi:hypothetical protein